jgi:SET domain-containing protein
MKSVVKSFVFGTACFVAGRFWAQNEHRKALQNETAELFQQLSEALNQEKNNLAAMYANIESILDSRDGNKFFLEDFQNTFNVEFLNENQVTDSTEHLLDGDAKNDERYTNNPEYTDRLSELYVGYAPELVNQRQIYVKWAGKEMGYGVFANMNLPANQFLGDYVGIVTDDRENTDYMWNYPTKDGGSYGVDSRYSGNMLRFVNDVRKDMLNCEVVYYVKNNMWSIGYRTTKPVMKDEQLFVSYGSSYWRARHKHDPSINAAEVQAEETDE